MNYGLTFDVAAGSAIGARNSQEDCFAYEFSDEANAGFAVLSDGMGGYAGGVAAASFLVTGVTGELQADLDEFHKKEFLLSQKLNDITHVANRELGAFIQNRGKGEKMGATLLSVAVSRNRLYWASVGDSALYLFRDGTLRRLNADHSMSAQIDFMIEAGMISEEKGRNHPDRGLLLSAIHGKEITKIDNPKKPVILEMDDVILMASDGLSTLSKDKIEEILVHSVFGESVDIAQEMFNAVSDQRNAEQDNTTLIVMRAVPRSAAVDMPVDQRFARFG